MQTTEIQAYILSAMKSGKVLSSLHDSELGDFGVDLSGSYRDIPITTVRAMLRKGLIEEKKRWNVTDGGLIHIEYGLLTDDEPSITDRHNEWNGYEQAMAWEAVEEEWRRATDNRDFEPEPSWLTDKLEEEAEENNHRTFFDGLDDLEDHPF
jgi:hypothetical protein